MNRDETNEVSGVTDDQLGRTAEPYESGNWRGGVGSIIRSNPKSGTDTSRTQQMYSATAPPNTTPRKNCKHYEINLDYCAGLY